MFFVKNIKGKLLLSIFLLSTFILSTFYNDIQIKVYAKCNSIDNPVISQNVKSAILIEASTGKVIYEKNADEQLPPASVTKIMTLLLAFEKIDNKKMNYSDIITISKHAASMGGSQCFFEENEKQTVDTILKCIEVASGNDAAVAMAEHISGSEEAFVADMNNKAKELGMNNTMFKNACGLTADNHYSSARDISIMSRELIIKHTDIFNYSNIWMDSIIHKTSRGESKFDLANTNKFLKNYNGACGLKTGYTKEAKYCISAIAKRNNITLIAVVLGADTKEIRNDTVKKLLDYGFSKCEIYEDSEVIPLDYSIIIDGTKEPIKYKSINPISFPIINIDSQRIKKELIINPDLKPPIKKEDIIGKVKYSYNNDILMEMNIYSDENIYKISYNNYINDMFNKIFMIK